MTVPSVSIGSRRFEASTVITVAAVLMSGTLATVRVSSIFALPTALIALMIARAGTIAAERPDADDYPYMPPRLRDTARDADARIDGGEARRLLYAVFASARPMLSPAAPPAAALLDPSHERTTRDNVVGLVEACCITAIDLSRIDALGSDTAGGNPASTAPVAAARQVLTTRLTDAAQALTSLYLAGLGSGSPAADRVAELIAEVNADAGARQTAATQLGTLLERNAAD